ncbi:MULTISPECIES: fumarylacetoacetate hydrolase family protein [unclassified Curtobacterium]|uniref:fumarylacetoacetate hydrolase family protein n=1 Tax=unclassified Curtobacterium TaxID=257496 RepID=UPI0037F361D2
MQLARFRTPAGDLHVGRVDGDHVVDLTGTAGIGSSVRTLLADLPTLRPAIAAATGKSYALADVEFLAPVDAPQKFLGIGMNYRAHAAEALQAGIPTPTSQLWFNKQVSCIAGPYDDIVKPGVSEEMDYEIELGVVIGTRCRHVAREDAREVVAGYVVVNDVSVRDWLAKRSPTFTLGKSFDTHGPFGPWLTTDDEVADPHDLALRLWVNGEERQNARTNDMIYDVYDQIAYLTTVMTLEPGDVLATGTPSGIGAPTGAFLRPGDVVRGEIDGLGVIENRVVAES